jgi:hypothetical protein
MKTLLAIALTLMITPAMARERAMVKLPIVYVMFGFQFLGAPDPNPGWFPMGAYDTKASCMAAEDEAYKSENIHRVSLKCVPYSTKVRLPKDGTGDDVEDRIPPCGRGGARQFDEACPKARLE